VLVEREVGHQALQARILIAHLTELPHLGRAEAAVLLLREVERRFGNAHLPTDIGHRGAGLGQSQGVRDLLLGVAGLLHRFSFPLRGGRKRPYSTFHPS